jgi:hypothetical protein
MPIDLRLSDGTTTVQLTSTSALYPALLEYSPQTAEQDIRTIISEADGYEQPNAYWREIKEQARIAYTPSDMTSARAALVTLNQLFEQARQRQNRVGAAVYVKFRPDTSDTLYRSEVYSGKAWIDDIRLPYITVEWTRRYYWETDSETQLNLYNTIQTTPASTITLRNCFYAANSYSNVAKIAAAQVGGDMPATARLQLTNLSVATGQDYYIGQMLEGATAMAFTIEAESGTNYVASSNTTNASYSGGAYTTLNNNTSSESKVWDGNITAAMLAAAQGYRFRIQMFATAGASAGDVRARAKVTEDGLHTLYESQYVTLPGQAGIVDFGSVQLPPRVANTGTPYPLKLEIFLWRSGGGSIPVDYFHFTPVSTYRILKSNGYPLTQNYILNDNPTDRLVYSDTGSQILYNYTPNGSPAIMLTPNRINVLTVIHTPTDPFRQTRLAVFYRARRLQL